MRRNGEVKISKPGGVAALASKMESTREAARGKYASLGEGGAEGGAAFPRSSSKLGESRVRGVYTSFKEAPTAKWRPEGR